jgi:signal transduction histidine kinase
MPFVRRAGLRIGDWLATVGWGKFILVALLLLIVGGMLGEALLGRSPAVIVETGGEPSVNVNVSVTPDGVHLGQPGARPPKPPAAPAPPKPPAAPGQPAVTVDDAGVRIRTQKDGKQVGIVIDSKGIRVEESRSASPSAPVPADGEVVLPPEAGTDPEKMAEAIEAARDRIEEIVSQQIDQQVARRTRAYREQSGDWFLSFAMLLVLTGVIVKLVLGSKKKAEVRAQAATATAAEEGLKRQLAEAQLKMMQAQVEPHFLFNTLASVDYLIETDPGRASKMQKNLIQYLRAALPQMREGSTTLGKEIALCRAYLEILKVRMDDRLQFAINVPQGLASAQFPPMMLQSLVENAIKHGLEPKADGGALTISADISHGMLRVTVADTGLGFGAGGTAGTGVGLANVRERLAALYGASAKLQVESNMPSGTIAIIEVPYTLDAGAPAGAAAPRPAAQGA